MTVVVAVYNTMPYLEQCLTSLVEQSIGLSRLQVVAVDDGSTDGSGDTLDRFAAAYPSVIEVLHQPNSGGPAAPSNRALDVATGRYVYFLGADDYLGTEALERMVGFADEHDSDVVIGKMVGVNGRGVRQQLFGSNQIDVDPYGPDLRWAIANTKLFRRSLVEKHHLRYPEDMAFGSDQPFTLGACVHANRISVLADYTCYYAVTRDDESNISFLTTYAARVPCIGQMMQAVADLVPAGPHRDTLLTRHFAWEIPRLLNAELLELPVAEQLDICAGIRGLADQWLNERILADLSASARLRVSAAALEDADLLAAVIRDDSDPALPVHLKDDQAFACYAGFGASDLPEHLYRVAPPAVAARLSGALQMRTCRWSGRSLAIDLRLPIVGCQAATALSAELRSIKGGQPAGVRTSVASRVDATGSAVCVKVDRKSLLAAGPGTWRIHLVGDIAAGRYDVRVPLPPQQPVAHAWRHGRLHRVAVTGTPRGDVLAITVSPVPAREIVMAAFRRLRSKRK